MKKVIIIQTILVVTLISIVEYLRYANADTSPTTTTETIEQTSNFFSITRVLLSVVIGFFAGAFMEGFFEAMFNLEKRPYGGKISLAYFLVATVGCYLLLWKYW